MSRIAHDGNGKGRIDMVRDMIFARGRHHDELISGMLKSEYERMKEAPHSARP
ncbi:hypothetical protein M5W83_15335 [Paenibacillus thiaminolyticus]|uniref:Uncharacterized protein n=1 Tax=Paenibacillus thiaminolyticus TaxID=49283 RepID=A0ABT4FYI1_PANTH|nr:hypothetical protein [Paenibacillus thiaminolyticus]MCY9534552.1 hypothetical protein [Paenibacillus thiaminolyticus]MCY9600154.1 hypothetical protein [Paenibacillus thiaminolyticus]MCY9608520.1 hypothetical protein [Paenibacillus thiaminolyticus]MCY9615188.1 hypothetical protein [Paenibacillus thiaminolyticus]MCY9620604.1 hypothetical protein [Paenibacillus thiaminolyticus]